MDSNGYKAFRAVTQLLAADLEHMISAGAIDDEEDIAMHRQIIADAQESIRAQLPKESAAPSAIPEAVRETLSLSIANVDLHAIRSMPPEQFERWTIKRDAARAWLASVPVATEKAVCPNCGSIALLMSQYVGATVCKCADCSHMFERTIAFISPPREVAKLVEDSDAKT